MIPWLRKVVTLDLRSLALCRIFTGLVILGDLISRAQYFTMQYTDAGILPRQALFELGILRFPSLYAASGWPPYVGAIFVLHGVVALLLSAGYQTRITSVLAWYLTISLQQRIYMANNGGDTVLAVLLFWGMFLPWGETLSIDSKTRERDPASRRAGNESFAVASTGTALLVAQIVFIYWISVFHKMEPIWLRGEVLYYAFQSDLYARPIAQLFLPYDGLMKGLAYGTLGWEFVGPLLLLSPRPRLRLFACCAFAFMHLNFGLFLRLGIFGFSPVLFLIALLPGTLWSGRAPAKLLALIGKLMSRLSRRASSPLWPPVRWTRELRSALWLLFFYGFLTAIAQDARVGRLYSERWDPLGQLTGLYQRWSVFVNLPEITDGWFVVEGRLADGSEVDLFQGFAPVRWDKPPTPFSRYDSFRWPTPMVVIAGDPRFHKWFVRALALDWERDHPGARVVWARFNLMRERTMPGFHDSPASREVLWEGIPPRP